LQAQLEAARQQTSSTPTGSEVGSSGTPAPPAPAAEVEPQGSAAAGVLAGAAHAAFAPLHGSGTPPASPARRLARLMPSPKA
jgi:hypothetical protein